MENTFKKGGISVQTEHIFPVIKKWLYSEKDIFLRELVSNAADAITKLRRLESLGVRDGNGEAYLLQEEEEMILSVCRNTEEEELMRSCTYAYQYPANLVLKSFREEKKDRK